MAITKFQNWAYFVNRHKQQKTVTVEKQKRVRRKTPPAMVNDWTLW